MRLTIPNLYSKRGKSVSRPVDVIVHKGEIQEVLYRSHISEVAVLDIKGILEPEHEFKIYMAMNEEKLYKTINLTINTMDKRKFEMVDALVEYTPKSPRNANCIVHSLTVVRTNEEVWGSADSGTRMKVQQKLEEGN